MDWRCTCLNERVDNRPTFTIGNRGQGKTTLLIKRAAETNGIIVCSTNEMAIYISRMAKELGHSIPKPITYDMWQQTFRRMRNQKYYFDEYGMILLWDIQKEMGCFEQVGVKDIMIDRESINHLNDILGGLKVYNMDGKKLKLKIELCEED